MNSLIVGLLLAGVAPKTGFGMPGDPAIGKGDKSVPTTINYQAYITHKSDTTPLDTTANFTFRIYNAPSGGNLLWTENQSDVPVIKGILDTRLGINNPLPPTIFYTGQTLWLEVVMGTETFSPRKALVSAGQAFHAQRADTADYLAGGGSGNYIQNQHASMQSPGAFWIADSATVGNTAGKYARLNHGNYGVYGQYNTSRYGYMGGSLYGAYGQFDASNYGYLGGNGVGAYGIGSTSGVYGQSISGIGVFAINNSSTFPAFRARNDNASGNIADFYAGTNQRAYITVAGDLYLTGKVRDTSVWADTADYAKNIVGGNFIQNQHTSAQSPGTFWIADSATVGNTAGKYARLNHGNYGVYGQYNT
ncbi:MAG: hypothetical protein ABIM59_07170, partial [candidate division WOR-3 bacterium]